MDQMAYGSRTHIARRAVAHSVNCMKPRSGIRPLSQLVVTETQPGMAVVADLRHKMEILVRASEEIPLKGPL